MKADETGYETRSPSQVLSDIGATEAFAALTVFRTALVGVLFPYAGGTLPTAFLIPDGRAVSRTAYALLFSKIGTKFGAGDGSTTFNLPDARGKALMGADALFGGTALGLVPSAVFGTSIGEASHVLSSNEMPAHKHTLTDAGHAHALHDAGHWHSITDPGHNHGVNDPGHAHGVNDPGHGHVLPSFIGNYYPDAAGLNFIAHGGNLGIGDHGTNASGTGISIAGSGTGIWLNGSGTGISINVSGAGITIDSATSGITMASNGSGAAHNNVQPSLAVNVMIYAGTDL